MASPPALHRCPLVFLVAAPLVALVCTATAACQPDFDRKAASVTELCARYNGFDRNQDGVTELNQLTPMASVPTRFAPVGSVVILVEARLLREPRPRQAGVKETGEPGDLVLPTLPARKLSPESEPPKLLTVLRASLNTFAADVASLAYDVFLVSADLYAGPRHQDGETLLAIRRFLSEVRGAVPDLRGVILVGSFPEALLVRQCWWPHREPTITLNVAQAGAQTFRDVDVIDNRGGPAAYSDSSDIVLADLDGRWDQIYHQGRETVPGFIAVFPAGDSDRASCTTRHYELFQDPHEDFFFIHDGDYRTEAVPPASLRFIREGAENSECAPQDLPARNPIALPEIALSRINPRHVGVRPDPDIVGTAGERLLGSDGLPQAVTLAGATTEGWRVWKYHRATELRLLNEYLARNHAWHMGANPDRYPACLSYDFGSAMPALCTLFPQWRGFSAPGMDGSSTSVMRRLSPKAMSYRRTSVVSARTSGICSGTARFG
ncbi:MAG: hypothetical protein FJX75_14570 [Armatimonadetes bacterium]|nr:hypothetical protein [Armatimonadota bacterium]